MEPSQPGFIRPSQLGKHASLLHKMSVEVSISQKKKNMVAVNMSKQGSIICVNSQYTETEQFCTFAVFHSLRIQPQEVDTNLFSDQYFKNEIIKAKNVKPIQEKLQKLYVQIITDACLKIAVIEICSEKNNRESVVGIFEIYLQQKFNKLVNLSSNL